MAQTIKLKRSANSTLSSGQGIPTTSQLALGEVAINTHHGKVYIKKDDGSESIVEIGGGNLPLTGGSLSGSLTVAGLLSVTNNPIKITASAPELIFSVPSGGLDSRIHNDGSGNFIFGTGANSNTPTERMRITAGGNVGIGTNSPARQFHLHDSSASYLHLTNGTTGSTASDGASISMAGTSLQISNRENGVLQMYTNGTERMRIDSSGRVGIGTATFTGASSYMDDLVVYNATSGSGAGLSIIANATNGYSNIAFGDTADWDTGRIQYNHTDNSMALHVNSAERMRIDSSGNVGIGTNSPNALVELASNANDRTFLRLHQTAGSGNNFGVTLAKIQMNWIGDDNWASINFEDERTSGTGTHKSGISFTTRSGNNAGTEAMRITNAGRVGIGTTSPATKFHVYGGNSGSEVDVATFRSASGAFNIKCSDLSAANPTWTLRTFSAEPLAFGQGTNERMRIDSSGNVLVGTTSSVSTSSSQTGAEMRANGIVVGAVNGNVSFIGNRIGSNGDIALFRRDGTTVGSISVNSGYLGVGAGAVYLGYYTSGSTKSIIPMGNATGGAAAGTIDLGLSSANHKFKDLHLAGTANVGGLTVNSAFTLPTADGSANQVLKTDGSGNVSWSSVNAGTTYSAGAGLVLTGTTFKANLISDTAQTVAANSATTTTSRTYAIQQDADGDLVVNVPWSDTDTVYTLPLATNTVRGGIELFSNTDQTVAANAVTTTTGRTYGVQLNSDNQAVVNVPWSDTNTDTDTTYSAGTGISLSGTTFSLTDTNAKLNLSGGTLTGNLLIDSASAEINLKSGVGTESGAINWTFNTASTDYASIKLPYGTRATKGLWIDSGYPITVDATTRIDFDISGSTKMVMDTGGLSVTGKLAVGDASTLTSTSETFSTTSASVIASFSASTYGAAKVIVTVKDGSNRHICEMLVTHNGTTAIATQYGSIYTSSELATFEVDISGGNVRILATASSSNSTVYRVAQTLMEA